jgi:prephenate dehydrogenase
MTLLMDKLVVVGVGLIGGSVAAALRRAGMVRRVVGVGRGQANLKRALALGVIDEAASDLAQAAAGADLVLVSVPVAQVGTVLAGLTDAARRGTIITDAGSTKRDFIDAARSAFGQHLAGVVPGHPIAGAELAGVDAATPELFVGKRVVLTPLPESRPEAVTRVESMWAACGARVTRMEAEHHDRIFSAVSHLPHVLAFALVAMIAGRKDGDELFSFAAGGFRDFTRIAGSSPEMWRDICLANGDLVADDIAAFQDTLAELAECIRGADGEGVRRVFEGARDARQRWMDGKP